MAIDLDKLAKYPSASWALWDKDFGLDLEYVKKNKHLLKNNIVFLGLNRSGKKGKPFSNFHTRRGDLVYPLKKFIQGNDLKHLKGAYMTDLYGNVEGQEVPPELPKDDSSDLENQLKLLGGDEYHIICFGEAFEGMLKFLCGNYEELKDKEIKSFSVDLKKCLNGRSVKLYGIRHYSRNNRKYYKELEEQLKYLNKKCAPNYNNP